mgnify:CR=1 FL=1
MLCATPREMASVVFAAGKGSRMTGYDGNKTLLPLTPTGPSPYEGDRPMLLEVLKNLPPGPKGVVVHYRAEDVRRATEGSNVTHLYQEVTNGTGGALLAARPFIESVPHGGTIVTMGDVPLIRSSTYLEIARRLDVCDFVILAFSPDDRAQYGMLVMAGDRVSAIVEWKYWSTWPVERQAELRFCNAGVYAARRELLLSYLGRLAAHPHRVRKLRGGQVVTIEEYFLTDLVEWMNADGLSIGVVTAPEEEVMGVDTPEALHRAQERFATSAA